MSNKSKELIELQLNYLEGTQKARDTSAIYAQLGAAGVSPSAMLFFSASLQILEEKKSETHLPCNKK